MHAVLYAPYRNWLWVCIGGLVVWRELLLALFLTSENTRIHSFVKYSFTLKELPSDIDNKKKLILIILIML